MIDGFGLCCAKARVVDLAHNDRRLVSNGLGKAEVLISLDWRDIEKLPNVTEECRMSVWLVLDDD